VIDEKTPNIDLIPLCSSIRSLRDFKHTPIIIITRRLKKSFMRSLIKAGATDFLREPLDEDEFHLRVEMAKHVMETQTKMSGLTPRLSKETPSTPSLEKRIFLDDRATRIVGQALSEKKNLALILLEIDQYHQVLKARGENVTHALTIEIEERLQKVMRMQDLFYNQNLGKFAVFLPKTSCMAAVFIAENIQEYLDGEVFSTGNIRFHLTASMGVASLDQEGDETKSIAINLDRLLSAATHCLLAAKEKKNTIVSKQRDQT